MKKRCFKIWKASSSREKYVAAKRLSNQVIYHAKNESLKFCMQKSKADLKIIFRLAKQLKKNNADIIGKEPIINNTGSLSLNIKESCLERTLHQITQP